MISAFKFLKGPPIPRICREGGARVAVTNVSVVYFMFNCLIEKNTGSDAFDRRYGDEGFLCLFHVQLFNRKITENKEIGNIL